MSPFIVLYKKEFKEQVFSPSTFVIAGLFVLIIGWLFFNYLSQVKNLNEMSFFVEIFRPLIGNMNFIFLFLSPLIGAFSIAGEKKQNTMELLLMSPLSLGEIILAKYLGLITVGFFLLSMTFIIPITMGVMGVEDWGPVLTGYLGVFFSISCYMAVALFCSVLLDDFVASALLSFCVLLGIMLLVLTAAGTSNQLLGELLSYLAPAIHFEGFARGVIKTYSLFFFFSFVSLFNYAAFLVLKLRRV